MWAPSPSTPSAFLDFQRVPYTGRESGGHIAVIDRAVPPSKRRETTQLYKDYIEKTGPDGYLMPNLDPVTAETSFKNQAKTSGSLVFPDANQVDILVNKMLDKYPHQTKRTPGFTENGFSFNDEWYSIVVSSVSLDKNPGYPWILMGCQTNSQVLEKYPAMLETMVRDMFDLYTSLEWPSPDPLVMCEKGWIAPVNTFIKNEPHKEKKINEHRERLIDGTSLQDQLFDRYLSMIQSKLIIDCFEVTPNANGFGHCPEHIQKLIDHTPSTVPLASTDVPGWDWRVTFWSLVVVAYVTASLQPFSWVYMMVLVKRAFCLANVPMVIGRKVYWCGPNKQKSGSYWTTLWNTMMRVSAAFYLWVDWARAAGDDCNETNFDSSPESIRLIEEAYNSIGLPLKEYNVYAGQSEFDFCSWKFNRATKRAYCENLTKAIYNLLNQVEVDASQWHDFISLYIDSPALPGFLQTIRPIMEKSWTKPSGSTPTEASPMDE